MPDREIAIFREAYLAIYRPIKKTYSIIGWIPEGSYWKRAKPPTHGEEPAISIRYQTIPPATAKINVIKNNTRDILNIQCMASGQYLIYGSYRIPIIVKKLQSPCSFPFSIFTSEFSCDIETLEVSEVAPLWQLTLEQPVQIKKKQGIPQRVAWILAENACQKDETCPITLDTITPMTAAVTSCFHVFQKDALTRWFLTNTKCPLCKEDTVATEAFTEEILEAT
jgi:hypothetical protein